MEQYLTYFPNYESPITGHNLVHSIDAANSKEEIETVKAKAKEIAEEKQKQKQKSWLVTRKRLKAMQDSLEYYEKVIKIVQYFEKNKESFEN